ncbi:LysR family transcriptional regulator [Salmonella enterica subsp. enterica]|uniref:LysR family transcriptional regulator n=1 Tax=Salmonella enterica I TaxID=59201 RepID=A0A447U2Z2_SALET|nr:LysR family transcriptional regulator [Salmonella enterica subsp. enterica]
MVCLVSAFGCATFIHLSAVAQQGTLGRAAETLNLSQPALSKTLNELEQLTGTRLFERGRLGRAINGSWRTIFDSCGKSIRCIEIPPGRR